MRCLSALLIASALAACTPNIPHPPTPISPVPQASYVPWQGGPVALGLHLTLGYQPVNAPGHPSASLEGNVVRVKSAELALTRFDPEDYYVELAYTLAPGTETKSLLSTDDLRQVSVTLSKPGSPLGDAPVWSMSTAWPPASAQLAGYKAYFTEHDSSIAGRFISQQATLDFDVPFSRTGSPQASPSPNPSPSPSASPSTPPS